MSGFQYNNEYLVGSKVYNYSDADFYFLVMKIDSNSIGDNYLRVLVVTIDRGILLAGSSYNPCQENSFYIVWSLFLGQL